MEYISKIDSYILREGGVWRGKEKEKLSDINAGAVSGG